MPSGVPRRRLVMVEDSVPAKGMWARRAVLLRATMKKWYLLHQAPRFFPNPRLLDSSTYSEVVSLLADSMVELSRTMVDSAGQQRTLLHPDFDRQLHPKPEGIPWWPWIQVRH